MTVFPEVLYIAYKTVEKLIPRNNSIKTFWYDDDFFILKRNIKHLPKAIENNILVIRIK
jgi:hypothetical protein